MMTTMWSMPDSSSSGLSSLSSQTWYSGVTGYNVLMDDVADDFHLPTAPAVAAAADLGFEQRVHTWDPAHPNAAGEVVIAAAVADALAELGVGPANARPLPTVPLGPRRAAVLSIDTGEGLANLTWSGPPGATGQYVWRRDVTLREGWSRLPDQLSGSTWTDGGLTNGHRYAFGLQPVKGWWAAEDDIRSNVVEVVPGWPYVPDAVIKRAEGGGWVGGHVYGSYTTQQVQQTLPRTGSVRTAVVRVRNDGNSPARFAVTGTAGGVRFRVQYLVAGVNRTPAVVDGRYRTPLLAPRAYVDLRVRVTRLSRAVPGDTRTVRVQAASLDSPTRRDAVATRVRASRR